MQAPVTVSQTEIVCKQEQQVVEVEVLLSLEEGR